MLIKCGVSEHPRTWTCISKGKMIIISHRGNLLGPDPFTENSIKQIEAAIDAGFQVEVDLRLINGCWMLGHDCGQYYIDSSTLKSYSDYLWCHAKNSDALSGLMKMGMHCFWHQSDCYTITSRGIIWAYPNNYCENAILVMPSENFVDNLKQPIYGICTDYPSSY